jgi:hypothetical protein
MTKKIGLLLLSPAVLANGPEGIYNPALPVLGRGEGGEHLAYLVATFLKVALIAAGLLLLLYLVWGGFEWLTSGGSKEAVASAKNRLTAAFTGLVLILLVLVIINFIDWFFDINLLAPEFPEP